MILWGLEHEKRAKNLGCAMNEIVMEAAPLRLPGAVPECTDKTLTIWGHGNSAIFAEMTPAECGTFIRAWKTRNPSLENVELVTCDARHTTVVGDSYTDALMPLLVTSATTVMVYVRCLPRGGSKATTSILYATEVSGSDGYYFIAGEDAAALNAANAVLVGIEKSNNFAAKPVTEYYKDLIPLAAAAFQKAAMAGPLNYVSAGGLLPALRKLLVPVSAYKQNGKVVAVPQKLG